MKEETNLVVEVRKNTKSDRQLVIPIISLIISIIALLPQCVSCNNTTKEKIQIKTTRNAPFQVKINKGTTINSIDQAEYILRDYICNYATLSDYNIHPTTEIIANITNNSSFMVAITDTKIYATEKEDDLNRIHQYEKLLEETHGLIPNNMDTELQNFYEKFNCTVNDKNSSDFKPFGYTLESGDIITKWQIVEFKFYEELEKELKKYMKQNIGKYNLSSIKDCGTYYECAEFTNLLCHAMYDYCSKNNQNICYTYQITTSRGNRIIDTVPLFIP